MRYMIIVKATPASETGIFPPHMPELMAAMGTFHEELARAGVLLDAAGLAPSAQGWGYAVFGKVVAGMDVVDKIRAVKTGARDVPLQPVVINKASIQE